MPITEHLELDGPTTQEAWKLYEEVFADIDSHAAARHLMYESEFVGIAANQHIRKYLVRDDAGVLVGMSTLTNDLESVPLISPRFFARRWPDHFQRGAIWYCGFVGAGRNDVHAYADLVLTMWKRIRSNNGIVFMDYCQSNVENHRIPQRTRTLMARYGNPVHHTQVDAQTFWIMEAAR